MRTKVVEDYILHLKCKTDSSLHQFEALSNKLFKGHRVSAWAMILTVVGEMAFRLSLKPADNAEHGDKT